MPTFTAYKQEGNVLHVYLPVSDDLIRDAGDATVVAKMAGELAYEAAEQAVIARRLQHDDKEN